MDGEMAFDRALDSLLMAAQIPRYYQANWFADCRLEKSILFVPDRETGECLVRLFGEQLRRVIPDLLLRVSAPIVAPKGKPSVLKKAYQARLTEDLG